MECTCCLELFHDQYSVDLEQGIICQVCSLEYTTNSLYKQGDSSEIKDTIQHALDASKTNYDEMVYLATSEKVKWYQGNTKAVWLKAETKAYTLSQEKLQTLLQLSSICRIPAEDITEYTFNLPGILSKAGKYQIVYSLALQQWVEKYPDQAWDWTLLSGNPAFATLTTFEKYPDKPWDWTSLSQNPSFVTLATLTKYPNAPWKWDELSGNPCVTMDMIEATIDAQWDWSLLSYHASLALYEKYPDSPTRRWDWVGLSVNRTFTTLTTFEKYPDKHRSTKYLTKSNIFNGDPGDVKERLIALWYSQTTPMST